MKESAPKALFRGLPRYFLHTAGFITFRKCFTSKFSYHYFCNYIILSNGKKVEPKGPVIVPLLDRMPRLSPMTNRIGPVLGLCAPVNAPVLVSVVVQSACLSCPWAEQPRRISFFSKPWGLLISSVPSDETVIIYSESSFLIPNPILAPKLPDYPQRLSSLLRLPSSHFRSSSQIGS